jgi:3-hydroxyacyl-[acyl-carrier-protein] dehydratase
MMHHKLPISTVELEKILPHRYPFMFIDQIVEFEDAVRIVGKKNVTINEPYFAGHFPGRPILPGVIIIEALAQLGVVFAKLSTGGMPADRLMVFSGVSEAKFRKPVFPGDTLTLVMKDHKRKGRYWRMVGEALVGDELACEAIINASEID